MRVRTITRRYFFRHLPRVDVTDCPGPWTPHRDLEVLVPLIAASQPQNSLEIGTAWGHFTSVLTRYTPTGATVWTVGTTGDLDVELPSYQRKEVPSATGSQRIGREANHFGLEHKVRLTIGDSRTIDWDVFPPMGLIYVDGAHDETSVLTDTTNAYEKLQPDGILAWHDFGKAETGVLAAVKRFKAPETVFSIEDSNVAFLIKGRTSIRGWETSETRTSTDPLISIVLPCHENGAALLKRTLASLHSQTLTPDLFEVVVAADGGDPNGVLRADVLSDHPFTCRLVESSRLKGEHLPHRNHARNAGSMAAHGDLVWVLDADFLLPLHTLAHLLTEYQVCLNAGRVAVLSPLLTGISENPVRWLECSEAWSRRNDVAEYISSLSRVPITKVEYGVRGLSRARDPIASGRSSSVLCRPSLGATEDAPVLDEGFPCLPRTLLQAMGWDEGYVGWGGNKEDLVLRLRALASHGTIDLRLLESVTVLHQPHPSDPLKDAHHPSKLLVDNRKRFRHREAEIAKDVSWWVDQRATAEQVVLSILAEAESGTRRSEFEPQPDWRARALGLPCVGLIAPAVPSKGLYRDAECVTWALRQPPGRPRGLGCGSLSVFLAEDVRAIDSHPERARASEAPLMRDAVQSDTQFLPWLDSLDVLVVFETYLPNVFRRMREKGKRVIYVPNVEWACVGSERGSTRWAQGVVGSGCEVWAKTRKVQAALKKAGVSAELLPWSIPDKVVRNPSVRSSEGTGLRLLLNGGSGGWKGRRGIDLALRAFERAREVRSDMHLRLKLLPDARLDEQSTTIIGKTHVELIQVFDSREDLNAHYEWADALLYPNRWDGFGLSLLEALHAGLPCIATDGWPMSELVEHEHNGLLCRASQPGSIRLAPRWECDVEALANAIIRLATEPRLRDRLTCPEPGELVARQDAFVLGVRSRVLGEHPPRVVLLKRGESSNRAPRPSEMYWHDALVQHGYIVDVLDYWANKPDLEAALASFHDFVLVGKAPAETLAWLREVTKAPLVMWHHDLVDFYPERAEWFDTSGPLCDLALIPEAGRADQHRAKGTTTAPLLPATRVHGDRGPGRRPTHQNKGSNKRFDVAFLGGVVPGEAREQIVKRLLMSDLDVQIHGDTHVWKAARLRVNPPLWDADADALVREARVTLCPARGREIEGYTSVRIFNVAGVAGIPLVEHSAGLQGLYDNLPSECFFDGPDDVVDVAARLIKNADARARTSQALEHETWRKHTWNDRVGVLLNNVARLTRSSGDDIRCPHPVPHKKTQRRVAAPPREASPRAIRTSPPVTYHVDNMVKYWNDRADRFGTQAVGHVSWKREQLEEETRRLWWFMEELISDLRGPEAPGVALDYGCGAGRLTNRLAMLGYAVWGADISTTMLRLARPRDRVALIQVSPIDPLPFRDDSFDLIMTCTVLQHIPEPLIEHTAQELCRVARPGAVVVHYENTHVTPKGRSNSGHVTFREAGDYLTLFPGLEAAQEFTVMGQRHTLLGGRLAP